MPEHPPTPRTVTRRACGNRLGRLLLSLGLALSTGCLFRAREATDETVRALAARPYDQLPDQLREKSGSAPSKKPAPGDAPQQQIVSPGVPTDVQTTAYMAGAQDPKQPPPKFGLHVPDAIPGSEAPLITLPADPAARQEALRKMYAPLPLLREEVRPLPGPNGQPYTLADFQRIAAENSPVLRQAASDVQAARGNMIQARTYPNPTVALQEQASNNNSTGGALGFSVDQVVVTGGKIRLATASAQKDLENAELALKRARSDLATQVRTAYYALLVAKETMRVTRALSVLTDEVYRVQLALTEKGGFAAAYEPAALRAQAYFARLAYQSAIVTYVNSWKLLTAAICVRQMPLSEVAGRIDAAVPYYEYDQVLARVLTNHTDVLTARNGIDKFRYNLKTAQITPLFPNLDVQVGMFKDRVLNPLGTYHTFSVGAPIPIWDQNRGNIFAAEAALARALEEPHRVEMALTTNLATAYTNYQTNLYSVEYYRKYILPDQVRAYRGVLQRRQVDPNAQFGDLVTAQQTLATSVTTYLGLLGTLWSSVVSVADLLQTDDLFQMATPVPLPPLPDLESLPPLPCCHPFGQTGAGCATMPAPAPVPVAPVPPVPVPPMPVPPMPAPAPVAPRVPPAAPMSMGTVPPAPVWQTEPVAMTSPPRAEVTPTVPSVFFLFFCGSTAPESAPPADVEPAWFPLGANGPPSGR
jgi:cobalt-zinc-cadmium efflux system outer membrane protein